jgi:Fe2+ or Zn2+ uptake regulation protein
MRDSPKVDAEHSEGAADAFDPKARVHLVCVTCNNVFETDAAHFDAKQCTLCRRAG